MKALVVYDSTWGSTEKIAVAIAEGLGGGTKAVRVGTADTGDLARLDMLVLGSPVLGGRPSEKMKALIDGIPPQSVSKAKVAVFDTRLSAKFAKLFGYASAKMADAMKEKGCTIISVPQGFLVKGRTGPLADGETEKAAAWGKELSHLT